MDSTSGNADAAVTEFWITDQQTVASFLHAALPGVPSIHLDEYGFIELREGDQGEQVTQLQQALIRLGYLAGEADGSYGPATSNAVRAFQAAEGLDETGIADSTMLAVLYVGKAEEILLDWVKRHDVETTPLELMQQLLGENVPSDGQTLQELIEK